MLELAPGMAKGKNILFFDFVLLGPSLCYFIFYSGLLHFCLMAFFPKRAKGRHKLGGWQGGEDLERAGEGKTLI